MRSPERERVFNVEGQDRHRHRLDQRHRPGHRAGAGRRRCRHHAERIRRRGRRSRRCAQESAPGRRQGRLQRRRHVEAGADRRHGRNRHARARQRRHPGEQRGHPAHRAGRGISGRALGRDHRDQSRRRYFHAIRPCFRRCGGAIGAASSTSPRRTASSLGREGRLRGGEARRARDSPRSSRWRQRRRASPATRFVPAGC